jgi:hypothetical protein
VDQYERISIVVNHVEHDKSMIASIFLPIVVQFFQLFFGQSFPFETPEISGITGVFQLHLRGKVCLLNPHPQGVANIGCCWLAVGLK